MENGFSLCFLNFLQPTIIPFLFLRGGEQGRNECNPVSCLVSADVRDRVDAH